MTSPATVANAAPIANAAAPQARPAIVAHRRCCEADGVGLSHYILIDHAAAAKRAEKTPAA